jgi:holo-[acyl-carrier protein] synthase
MIYGIGVDFVKISRMRAAVERWGVNFLKRIFTEDELAYCYEKKEPFPSLSVRFAAKEAFIKAIGTDVFIPLTEIEIVNDKSGRPSIKVKGKVKKLFSKKSIKKCHLSLSHEREFGIACVVLER